MSQESIYRLGIVLMAAAARSFGGEFINLDFEKGYMSTPVINLRPDGSGEVNREWWLPGWVFGDSRVPEPFTISYNENYSGATGGGMVYDRNYWRNLPLSGNLAVLGFQSTNPLGLQTLTQSGSIPPEAKSMWYDCLNGPWEVSIDGKVLPLYDPHRETKPILEFREVGVDVSEWAGKEVTLRLTQEPGYSFNALDNIRFSAEAIPEPKRASLLMIGWAALWVMSRR